MDMTSVESRPWAATARHNININRNLEELIPALMHGLEGFKQHRMLQRNLS
jgi:hypothetical protein